MYMVGSVIGDLMIILRVWLCMIMCVNGWCNVCFIWVGWWLLWVDGICCGLMMIGMN